jgi:ABC-type amino acid transport substrate-binding protein
MRPIFFAMAFLAGLSGVAFGQTSLTSEIAPGGKLRVGMIDITVLGGVGTLVAEFIGHKLGMPVELVLYPNPDAYLQSFDKAEWDVAIGPRVLAPPDKVDSTPDIWNINLVYVAAPGKEFSDIASVDKSDVNVGTIRGAPSDRVLTREIKNAKIIRIPLSPTISADAANLLRSGTVDVFGADSGVGYPIAETLQGSHVLPGAFAIVRVAASLPKGRSAAAQDALAKFIDEARTTGIVKEAIDAKGLQGVTVAAQ